MIWKIFYLSLLHFTKAFTLCKMKSWSWEAQNHEKHERLVARSLCNFTKTGPPIWRRCLLGPSSQPYGASASSFHFYFPIYMVMTLLLIFWFLSRKHIGIRRLNGRILFKWDSGQVHSINTIDKYGQICPGTL